MAWMAGRPPDDSRIVCEIHFATLRSSVRRLTLKAMSGLRAPTATAPPRG